MRIRIKHENLRRVLARRRLSQNRQAIRLGLSSGQLSDLTNGKRPYPSAGTRRKLLDGLELEFEELFEIEADRVDSPQERDLINVSLGPVRLRLEREISSPGPSARGKKMNTLLEDLRQNLLLLKRRPAFSLFAIFLLAIGIAANTAVYHLAYELLWAPLPYRESSELVLLSLTSQGQSQNLSAPHFRALADALEGFDAIAGYDDRKQFSLVGGDEPLRIFGATVTPGFFPVLGLTPVAGRPLQASDFEASASRAVVVSERLWERAFGRSPSLVGEVLHLNDLPYEVVGVMPANLRIPNREELWVPLHNHPYGDNRLNESDNGFLEVIGRLKAGWSVSQARAEVAGTLETMANQQLGPDHSISGHVWPLREELVGDRKPLLYLLSSTLFILLMIVCMNLAGLQLARLYSRREELAIRASLGASRRRLVQQVSSENLLLCVVAGVLGFLLAPVFGTLLSSQISVEFSSSPSRLFISSMLFSLFSSLLCGLIPAFRLLRRDLLGNMTSPSNRLVGAPRPKRLFSLVAAQMALSLMMITAAGLLLQSLSGLINTHPGFESGDNLTTAEVTLPLNRYPDPSSQIQFFAEALEELRSLPGIKSTSAASLLPLASNTSIIAFQVEGDPVPTRDDLNRAHLRMVWPGYFKSLGIPMFSGRNFDSSDRSGNELVVIVDQALAEIVWPGEDPIGKLVSENPAAGWRRVVGVAGNTMHWGQKWGSTPTIYTSALQTPGPTMTLVVKSAGKDRSTAAQGIRETVWKMDPTLPVHNLQSMRDRLLQSQLQPRESAVLLSLLGAVALILSSVGLYAVIAQNVQRRRQEIGLRMAIGARQSDVSRQVVRTALGLAVPGTLAGILGSLLLAGLLENLLFGVQGRDPRTLILASLAVLAVALFASWLPAHRAARVDPVEALRSD